ncbi:hypothetical protein H5410_061788 [Solanum commersonii]|uniref:SKP1 component dimerisation domain-containing protein n=1 Tax=Solanum commersonii TaxID=4109 RepID=A0A9J5WAN8_SOLCO|nr:hypothetical protein H5410_061788 [Solanum commersonii]
MSQSELVGALLAANCFDDTQLKEVIIQGFSDRIKGKTIEEICEVFGNVNDYTPKEEEEAQEGVSKDMFMDFDTAFVKILDMICQEVAYRIKGKIPEEICKEFDIKNDFTPEEEEDIRKDNA